jgi:hypothetical protein
MKIEYLLTILLGFMLFGCLGPSDTESIFLKSLSKQRIPKSYIMHFKVKLLIQGIDINCSGTAYVKDNNSRIDIIMEPFTEPKMQEIFKIEDKTYICTLFRSDENISCEEGNLSSYTYTKIIGLGSQPSSLFGTDVNKIKNLIDKKIIILPKNVREEKIAGRECYLFKSIFVDTTKASPWEQEELEALSPLKEFGIDVIIMDVCLDKETGVSLYTKISDVMNFRVDEFIQDTIISPDTFALPSQVVLKKCGNLRTKGEQEMYNCYYEFAGTNIYMCDLYKSDLDKLDCMVAIVNKTGDTTICEKLREIHISSYLMDDYVDYCYKRLALMKNDSSFCEKIKGYSKEYCYRNFGIYNYSTSK